MATKINEKALKDDILKYMKTFSEAYVKEGSKQLTNEAKYCIEQFYEDYTPHFYNRTYDLRDNSYRPYIHNNGRIYYGGVRITSDFMSPYYSGNTVTDAFTVAQLGWHGWHGDPTGYNGRFEPIKTTPPLDILTRFFKSEKFLKSVNNYAEDVAVNQSYTYLNFLKKKEMNFNGK